MKQILLFALAVSFFSSGLNAQSTAQDWTHTDCSSGSGYNLFTMLDSGKVVVMEFEMGCSSCSTAATNLDSLKGIYDVSNPSQVKFFLMDYWAGHTCSNVTTFISNNSLSFGGFVGCSADKNYYTTSSPMPMIVIAAGTGHSVYYKKIGYSVNDNGSIAAAINQALADLASGITTQLNLGLSVSIVNNPIIGELGLNVTSNGGQQLNLEVYNLLGQNIFNQKLDLKEKGAGYFKLNAPQMDNGIYFLRYSVGNSRKTLKFLISR
jgi:hypothetical protein